MARRAGSARSAPLRFGSHLISSHPISHQHHNGLTTALPLAMSDRGSNSGRQVGGYFLYEGAM